MALLQLVAPLSFFELGIPYIEDKEVGENNHPAVGAPLISARSHSERERTTVNNTLPRMVLSLFPLPFLHAHPTSSKFHLFLLLAFLVARKCFGESDRELDCCYHFSG